MPSKRQTRPLAASRTASPLRLGCILFKTALGGEPVREWLKDDIPAEARKTIGADIMTIQATWPIGKPLVDSLGSGLREVRSTHDKVEYRVIFILEHHDPAPWLHQDDQEDEESRHRPRARAQVHQGEGTMNKHDGSTLDSLFEELGELEEINAKAAKKILAVEAGRRMRKLGLTTTTLAERMQTSRNQIHRILDEEDAGITLKMLFRLAGALGMSLRVGFGAPARRRPHEGRARKRGQTRSGGARAHA